MQTKFAKGPFKNHTVIATIEVFQTATVSHFHLEIAFTELHKKIFSNFSFMGFLEFFMLVLSLSSLHKP